MRILVATAVACAASVIAYAALRVAQAQWFPEPNPAIVVASVRAGYFWRLWAAGYLGGMVLVGLAFAGDAVRARAVRWLPALVVTAALASVLQAAVVP